MNNNSAIEKEKVLSMTSKQLQDQIIFTLEHRESFRKKNLPTEVLKHMRVDIRRTTRAKFERRIFRALNPLISNHVIKEYKTKKEFGKEYIRIKLAKDYENKLLYLRSERPYLKPQAKNLDLNGKENLDDIVDSSFIERELPDLPDEEFMEDEEVIIENKDEDLESDTNTDRDSLLGIFLAETPDIDEEHSKDKSEIPDAQQGYLLESLRESYDKKENIETVISFRELKLKVKTDSGYIIVVINLYGVKKEIIVRSFIPFLEEAIIDILKHFSHIDYLGTLCIEEFQNQDFFSIRGTINITKYSKSEIISIIDQIIFESLKLEEIIDRHL